MGSRNKEVLYHNIVEAAKRVERAKREGFPLIRRFRTGRARSKLIEAVTEGVRGREGLSLSEIRMARIIGEHRCRNH